MAVLQSLISPWKRKGKKSLQHVVTKTRNDPQRSTTIHNDPQRPTMTRNDPPRPTTIHNDPTTIPQ